MYLTRNQACVYSAPRVRIPPSPPTYSRGCADGTAPFCWCLSRVRGALSDSTRKRRLCWAAVLPSQSAGSGRGRRTLGTGPTLRDDLLSLLRAVAPPCATWALSPGYDGLRKRTDHGFDHATDPTLAKDAVLPPWGSSGTWRCRAREMRQGCRSERRPPWRQNGGPHRSRCFYLPEPML